MRTLAVALLSLLLCALAAPRADAQILFAGGEDINFAASNGCGGNCFVSTNSSFFRSSWAREALGITNGDGTWTTPTFTAAATLWAHAQVYISGNLNSNAPVLEAVDSAGNVTLVVRTTSSPNSQVKISSQTAGGALTDLVTCTASFPNLSSRQQIDWYINYGTSGTTTLYVNSTQICTYSGNITNGDGATTLDQFAFAGPYPAPTWSSAAYWSEVVVATAQTTAMNLLTLAPNGNGNATQWSNSSGTTPCTSILNATAVNNANYVYTGANSQSEECTVTNSIPPGIYSVPAVVMAMNGLVGSSGPQHFQFLTRIAGTDYASSNFAPTNSFSNIGNYIQTTNPATSNPWAVTDLTASGFNIGLESQP